jgi:hypothetical protein
MADVITTELTYRKCGDTSKSLSGYVDDPLSAITSGTTYFYRGNCYEIITVVKYGSSNPPNYNF